MPWRAAVATRRSTSGGPSGTGSSSRAAGSPSSRTKASKRAGRGGDEDAGGLGARDAEGVRHAARRVEPLAGAEHGLVLADVDGDLALDCTKKPSSSSWWTWGGGWSGRLEALDEAVAPAGVLAAARGRGRACRGTSSCPSLPPCGERSCKLRYRVYTSESEFMSSEQLTAFSYAVLVLVGEGGAGPHDIVADDAPRAASTGRRRRASGTPSPSASSASACCARARSPAARARAPQYELTDRRPRRAARPGPRRRPHSRGIQNEPIVRVLAAGHRRRRARARGPAGPCSADLDEIDGVPRRGRGARRATCPTASATCVLEPPARAAARRGPPGVARRSAERELGGK